MKETITACYDHIKIKYNSSFSIFWLSNHAQNNQRQGSGETMNIPNVFFYFPGASSSIVLYMVIQPEYRKWAIGSKFWIFQTHNYEKINQQKQIELFNAYKKKI